MDSRPLPFTLRQLQYAVAVADELGFRKAAERCRVAQPSLSAQLAELEVALGTLLFERDRARVLLTPAGRELLVRARAVLREAEDLAVLARRAGDPLAGTLRIGVIPTISPYLLPRLAVAFRRAHPRLTVHWVEDKTRVLVGQLDAGELDAAIAALESELGDVEREELGDDPFLLAAPRGHVLVRQRSPMPPGELEGHSVLLLDEGHCFREQALAVCESARAQELSFRATSLPTLAQMVASGAGVTLLPELAAATEASRATLRLRRLAAPTPRRTVVLVWRRRSPLGPALVELAKTARAAYRRR